MPLPIKPVHQLDEHNEIFGPKSDSRHDISDLQSMFLGDEPRRTAAIKYDDETLRLLEAIDKNDYKFDTFQDEQGHDVKAFVSSRGSETHKLVPESISDNEMLRLKTQNLICGSGRLVVLTDKGRTALRDKWLREANALKTNRDRDKFDINTVRRAEAEENAGAERKANKAKFKRVNG